jgi:hypothetical protein
LVFAIGKGVLELKIVMTMKKQNVSTRATLIRFGAAVLLFFSLQASAHPFNGGGEPNVTIRYNGQVQDRIQFQVDLVSDNEETYLLQIQEPEGAVLYREKISKKAFTKKFEWYNGDTGSNTLIFTFTGLKSKKTQSFEVNTEVRTVNDVVINKL